MKLRNLTQCLLAAKWQSQDSRPGSCDCKAGAVTPPTGTASPAQPSSPAHLMQYPTSTLLQQAQTEAVPEQGQEALPRSGLGQAGSPESWGGRDVTMPGPAQVGGQQTGAKGAGSS